MTDPAADPDADLATRYPVGRFAYDGPTADGRAAALAAIAALPSQVRAAVDGLSDAALDTPYREGGWTARQVVHHLADSHLNASIRVRFALTEDAPTIKPYNEARWADLDDARTGDIAPSLAILDGLHARWSALLDSLSDDAFARTFVHPERERSYTLDEATEMYAWHGRHHLAHIEQAIARHSHEGDR